MRAIELVEKYGLQSLLSRYHDGGNNYRYEGASAVRIGKLCPTIAYVIVEIAVRESYRGSTGAKTYAIELVTEKRRRGQGLYYTRSSGWRPSGKLETIKKWVRDTKRNIASNVVNPGSF